MDIRHMANASVVKFVSKLNVAYDVPLYILLLFILCTKTIISTYISFNEYKYV